MKVFKKSAIGTAVSSLALASGAAALLVAPAHAQQATTQSAQGGEAKEADTLKLDQVVITATTGTKSKLRSSASVTDVSGEAIKDFGAHSQSEILLLIPGIRTEATAGEGGNANISVRGLPISSGGSKYVQLQEDGLPTVQFGDMNFSNNDYWIRFDNNVDRIETLRGGSSAVFASHAPGAVINYISKTGKDDGGSIGLTRGVNYKETRVDGDFGAHLSPDLYYHIGGYYRQGEGVRHATNNALEGYQLKGNITKEFNGGKGYVRLNFKALDEHAPTTPQTYLNASKSGGWVGGFSRTPGYDGTRDSQYSVYNSSTGYIDPVTGQRGNSSLTDGITVNSQSFGAEFHNELKNGWTVDDKFRMSRNSGAFQAQFWNVQTLDNYLAGFSATSPLNGGVPVTARIASGPGAPVGTTPGQTVSGNSLISNGAAINVQTPDMGNMVNDLAVTKQFALGGDSKLDMRGGWFHSRQNVVQRWIISERVVTAGANSQVVDLFDSTGAALTTNGLTGYNNQWGGCCGRDISAQFTTDAPYLNLSANVSDWDFEAGLRRETFRSDARYAQAKAGAVDVNGDGTISGAEKSVYMIDPAANYGLSNYKIAYTNYSLGANYRVTKNLSAFVRTSKGNRAVSDRLLFSANIDAVTGLLTNAQAALAPVKQHEVGVKNRGRVADVNYGLSATLFHSTTSEFDYDQTRNDDPTSPNFQGPKLNQLGYKSDGVEFESTASMGAFGIATNVVYSKEVITLDVGGAALVAAGKIPSSQVGKTSGGVPKWRYTIAPRYQLGNATIGATIRGQGWVYTGNDNTDKIKGHFIVNAFVNYEFGDGMVGALQIGNLFDKVYPSAGGGFVGGSSTVYGAGVETGRTISASLRYNF